MAGRDYATKMNIAELGRRLLRLGTIAQDGLPIVDAEQNVLKESALKGDSRTRFANASTYAEMRGH